MLPTAKDTNSNQHSLLNINDSGSEELGDQSVIIVGNGASLLATQLGPEIDAHDIVVRFNLFKIGKFAPHVGTKTTVWFNNRDAHSQQVKHLLKHHCFQQIYIHTWHDTSAAVQSFREGIEKNKRTTPVTGVDKHLIDQMRVFLGGRYAMFSTGAIGTWVMLQYYKRVTLVGFDWWHNPEKFHYGDDLKFNAPPGRGHQPQLERLFFERLVALDRLSFK